MSDLEMFVEMCTQIKFDGNEIYFPAIEYIKEFNHITKHPEYNILSEKMNQLIIILNENPRLIDSDIEKELWVMLK